MSDQQQTNTDRVDMIIGGLGSFVANLGYLLLVHGNQRLVLMMFATVLLGMGLLLSEAKGALGMGILIGLGAAIAAALIIVAVHGSIVSNDLPLPTPNA